MIAYRHSHPRRFTSDGVELFRLLITDINAGLTHHFHCQRVQPGRSNNYATCRTTPTTALVQPSQRDFPFPLMIVSNRDIPHQDIVRRSIPCRSTTNIVI